MPHIQNIYKDLGGKGLSVLSVNSFDKKDSMTDFLSKHPEYTTTMLFDPGKGAAAVAAGKYNVSGIPTVYLIDKDGNVAASFVGYSDGREQEIRDALAKIGVK